MVAESSQLLVAAFEKLSSAAILVATLDIGRIIEKKESIQKVMMRKLNEK
jgi:hypothetical protein